MANEPLAVRLAGVLRVLADTRRIRETEGVHHERIAVLRSGGTRLDHRRRNPGGRPARSRKSAPMAADEGNAITVPDHQRCDRPRLTIGWPAGLTSGQLSY